MHTLTAAHQVFAFQPDVPPALRVAPGEVVRFETSAAPAERLLAAGDDWQRELDVRAINALTGPVFVEEVAPGDPVTVEILAIETFDWGWNAFIPRFGALGQAASPPFLRRLPIRDGRVWLTAERTVPLRPMIGCLGLAPATGSSSSLAPPYPWGGNYDLTQASPGNTLLFPAQVAGGLFSLGDLHAAMGVGEGTGVAIECAGGATVRLGIRPGLRLVTPRIETPDRVYTVGLDSGRDLTAARNQALQLMFAFLTEERGLGSEAAMTTISAAVDLELGGPAAAVVLASVPWALVS